VGLFNSIKDMAGVAKQAQELHEQQKRDAGYKSGMSGTMQQMGDMLGQANQQLAELAQQGLEQQRILAEGIAGEAVIVGMGTPARGGRAAGEGRPERPGEDLDRLAERGVGTREG
jgi:hypothetical protein